MTTSCITQAIQAIYQGLKEDVVISSQVKGIFSQVPPHTSYPYVLLECLNIKPWETTTRKGAFLTLTCRYFQRQTSMLTMLNVVSGIVAVIQAINDDENDMDILTIKEPDIVFDTLDEGRLQCANITIELFFGVAREQ